MSSESLNLREEKKRLILKALDKYPMITKAAEALGVNVRTLYNLMYEFKIKTKQSCQSK